jgi:hypothetical protein
MKQKGLFPERFDTKKHELSDFAFTSTIDTQGFTVQDASKFIVRMRYLLGGDPALSDERKFRMMPEDAALVVGNCKKRLSTGFIPQLTEHGWGPEGGKSCGKALDVYEQAGDVWFLVQLTPAAYTDAVDPGLGWLSRSAGVKGWLDTDGCIRPADAFEGSFTNFPAMQGLGACEPMSDLAHRFATRIGSPASLLPTSTFTQTPNPSPDQASEPKGADDMISAENLKLLGLADGASQDDINKAVTAKFSAPPPEPKPQAKADKPLTLEMLDEIRTRDREADRKDLEEAFAKRERKTKIEAVIFAAEDAGKAVGAERETLRSDGELLGPERLEALLSARSTKAPTTSVFEPGHGTQAARPGKTITELCAARTDKIVRRNNMPGASSVEVN